MNAYKQALRIMQEGFDEKAVALYFAQHHPTEFVKAASVPAGALKSECLELIQIGKKISAIRHYRQMTGLSLKEAKEQIDAWA